MSERRPALPPNTTARLVAVAAGRLLELLQAGVAAEAEKARREAVQERLGDAEPEELRRRLVAVGILATGALSATALKADAAARRDLQAALLDIIRTGETGL